MNKEEKEICLRHLRDTYEMIAEFYCELEDADKSGDLHRIEAAAAKIKVLYRVNSNAVLTVNELGMGNEFMAIDAGFKKIKLECDRLLLKYGWFYGTPGWKPEHVKQGEAMAKQLEEQFEKPPAPPPDEQLALF